jgi:hypothetical protein
MDPLIAKKSPLDAPPVAGLSLVFQPASVFASSSSTLTLIVSVPIGSPAVTMTPSNGIAVAFPAADATNPPLTPLVTTLNGITTTAPAATWSIRGPLAGKLIIFPVNTTTLNPCDSFKFQFRSLSIVATVSTPSVAIQVTTSAGSKSTTLPIDVQAKVPGVIAWADPPSVALNATSTLRWTSQDGSTVVVSGFTTGGSTEKDFPVGGKTYTPVNPTLDSAGGAGGHYPYTVTLYAEPGHQQQGAAITVQVYLHEPYISQFGFVQPDNSVAPSITINYGEQVTALWRCIFVDPKTGIILSYGSTPPIYDAAITQYLFNPSSALAPNDNSVVVTLTAPGWNNPAVEQRTINYNPIRILYFKYTQWTSDAQGDHFSNVSWLTDPPTTQGTVVGPDPTHPDVQRLSVQGPGGPLTQYLGTGNEPYLEIRYFSPSGPVAVGKPFTLQWFTNNATSLTLTSAGGLPVNIPSNQVAKGTSQPLTINAATEYVLTATGTGGTVRSYLTVAPA